MFGHLIAIFLALFAIDLAPHSPLHPWPHNLLPSLIFSLFLYIALFGVLFLVKKKKKPYSQWVAHGALILFLISLLYFVGPQRFLTLPLFNHTITALLCFGFYFFSFAFYLSWKKALFFLPFVLPFVLYVFLEEGLSLFFSEEVTWLLLVSLILCLVLLLPLLFRSMWRCRPLPESIVKVRLEEFCRRQRFRHGGMQVWDALRGVATAAIVGILPRFRYILFTEALLNAFSEEEIEAVLAHEIGHSKHHHLVIYPCLLLGMIPLYSGLNFFLDSAAPLYTFLVEGAIFATYFRFVFGFFSRRFEAQADLYTITCGLPAATMISALYRLSTLHHMPLDQPNWHHGSLKERISTLEKAAADPSFIKKHTLRLRLMLLAYFLVLVITFNLVLVHG